MVPNSFQIRKDSRLSVFSFVFLQVRGIRFYGDDGRYVRRCRQRTKAIHGFTDGFWTPFKSECEEVSTVEVRSVVDALDERLGMHLLVAPDEDAEEGSNRKCPSCENGRLGLKPSKQGGFIGCSNYPACSFTAPLRPLKGLGDENSESAQMEAASEKSWIYARYGQYEGSSHENGTVWTVRRISRSHHRHVIDRRKRGRWR